MSDKAKPKAPKPSAKPAAGTPPIDLFGLDSEKFKSLEGIGGIMAHLEKGEWAEFVTAISALFTELFGTPEQKAELAKARKEAQNDKTKKNTKKDLDKLHSKVDKKDKRGEKIELVDKPKLGDGSDIVLIGDSIPAGMRNQEVGWDKCPLAIAEQGYSTDRVYELLLARQSLLKGKKKAILYCGTNNLFSKSPEALVQDMVKMAKICHKQGVSEIIVGSLLPADPRRKDLQKLIDTNAAFRDELIKAKGRGDFPPGVRVVDLITPFANEKGEMKEEYVDRSQNDPLHPRSAYGAALDYMLRGSKTKKS